MNVKHSVFMWLFLIVSGSWHKIRLESWYDKLDLTIYRLFLTKCRIERSVRNVKNLIFGMDRFWKYKLDHWLFWLVTVFFHAYTRTGLIPKAGYLQFLLEVVLRNGLLALVINFNLLVLIPRFAQQKKYIVYVLFLLLALVFYAFAKNAHDVYLHGFVMGDVERKFQIRMAL